MSKLQFGDLDGKAAATESLRQAELFEARVGKVLASLNRRGGAPLTAYDRHNLVVRWGHDEVTEALRRCGEGDPV